jgi:hypothetical protein
MKQKPDIIIAIDPDVDKSGVSMLTISTRQIQIESLSFPDLIDYLKYVYDKSQFTKDIIRVVVEAGWLNASNWHLNPHDSKAVAAAKGNATGRNHETGRKIVEMAKHIGLNVEPIKPLVKCWRGKDRKITHEELATITGITQRTNQDERDAVLLSWIYANLPIRLKVGKDMVGMQLKYNH